MALPREQSTELLFNAGMDQSEHAEAATSQLTITDGEYTNQGGISKRFGWSEEDTLLGTEHPRALLPLAGGHFGVLNKRYFEVMRPGHGRMTNAETRNQSWHGNVSTVAEMVGRGIGGLPGWTEVDGAVLVSGGRTLVCLVGSRSQASPEYAVFDADTRRLLASGDVGTNVFSPRVVAHGGKFIIYYLDTSTSDIVRNVLDPSSATITVSGPSTLVTTTAVTTGPCVFDVYAHPTLDRAVIASIENGGANIVVRRVDSSGTVLASNSTAHGGGTPRISLVEAGDGTVHLVEGRSVSNPYRVWRYAADLSSVTDTSTPGAQTNGVHLAVGIAISPASDASGVFIATESEAGLTQFSLVSTNHSTVSDAVPWVRVSLRSKPFVEYSAASANRDATAFVYAIAVGLSTNGHNGSGPPTPTTVIRIGPGFPPGGATVESQLMAVTAPEGYEYAPTAAIGVPLPQVTAIYGLDGKDEATFDWYIPTLYLTEALEGVGTAYGAQRVYSARMVKLEHAMSDPLPQTGPYVGGSVLRAYGGPQSFGELVPVWAPYLAVADGGAGSLGAGTYTYYAVLEHYDSDGRLRRSAPSAPQSVTVGASRQVTVSYIPGLPTSLPGNWRLKIYRTEAGGAEARFVTTVPVEPTARTVSTYTDNRTDADLADNQLLYTLGELQNEPPPPVRALAVHKQRVFGVDALDPSVLVYSKVVAEGFAPEFNASLRLRLEGHRVVSVASMDDKLLVFTETDVLALLGDGPDANGLGGFTVEAVAGGLRLSGPYNLAVLPFGVLLHTKAGMAVLGRDLQVTDISGPTRAEFGPSGATPGGATHIPALKRVYWRYDTLSASVVVFDYAHGTGRWYKHTCRAASSAHRFLHLADVGGVPYALTSVNASADCAVLFRDSDSHADAGAYVPLQIDVVNWRPGGLLDEVRLRRVHLVTSGDGGVGGLSLQLAAPRQPKTFDALNLETYAWTAAQFEDLTYGHLNVRPKYQRINAITLTITTTQNVTVDDSGPVIHGLVFDWAPTGRVARRHGLNPT